MCNPKIKQDYAVLRAFRDAGKPISIPELYQRVENILKPIGLTEVNDLADRDLSEVLLDLDIGEYASANADRKFFLTSEGRSMVSLLETYVREGQPELVQPELVI